jgi:enoyl-CoA hydratase/carnithine racemase
MTELKLSKIIGARNTPFIASRTDGTVRRIIYNRPEKSNAFNLEMYMKMSELIHDANKDPDIKFIVIVGEGKNFCTGNDLTNFQDPAFEAFTVNVIFYK